MSQRPVDGIQRFLPQIKGYTSSFQLKSKKQGRREQKEIFRIGELNPGLVGTDHLSMIESDKS
jgi:hypothetical protein